MITDHTFRRLGLNEDLAGTRGGIRNGMCCWLGRCNRPEIEHARKRGTGRARTR